MGDKCIFIDCDGVIINSEQRMIELKEKRGYFNHNDKDEFDKYFSLADTINGEWEYIIEGASSLNNSVEIIRELEKMKRKIAILTKAYSLKEMQIKVNDLRKNRCIYSPIIFVPPKIKKHEIIIPDNQMLIDNSNKNIDGWVKNGGIGVVFDKNAEVDSKNRVKSLEFLLRR